MKQENDNEENNNEENRENDKDRGIPDWLHHRAEQLAKGLFRNDERVKKNKENE